jgi:hypothetical protein
LLYGVKRPVKLGLSDKNAVGNREKSKKNPASTIKDVPVSAERY